MSEDFSSIKEVEKIVHLALPITYISNEIAGIKDILEGWRKQYNNQLEGILVNYSNVSLISRANTLVHEKVKLVLRVKAKFILFCPNVGDIAKGRIKRISKEHVGCIMHDTINAVIKLTEYYPDELEKYMRMNQDILFEITNFDRRPKEIFVVGKITENCLELMNDLIPLIPEEKATDFGFLNQNVIKHYDFDGIEIVPVKNDAPIAEVVNIDTGSEEDIMKTKKRKRDSSVSEDSEPRKKKKRKKDKNEQSVQNLNISQDAVVNGDLSTTSVNKDSSFSDDSKPKKKKKQKKDKSEHCAQDLNISQDVVVNGHLSMNSVDRDSLSGDSKSKKRKKQKKDKSEHPVQDLNNAQDFAINDDLNLISIKQEKNSSCSSSDKSSINSDNTKDDVENKNQPVKKSSNKNKSSDKELKCSKKKRKKKNKDEKKSNKKNSKKGKIVASGAILKTDKKSHKKKHSSKGSNKNKKDKSKTEDKKRKKSKHKDKNLSDVTVKKEC